MKKTQFTKKSIPVIIITVLFALSLIPAVYVGMFDYATGDDFGYGQVVKAVIRNGGSLIDCIRAAWQDNIAEYYRFQGNLVCGFLWRFMPAIWSERLYVITPLLALTVLILGHFLLFYELLVKERGCSRAYAWIISCLISFLTIQFMPYPRGGIYWFTGMLHYTFPYGILLMVLAGSLRFFRKPSVWLLILLTLGSLVAGGSGFPEGVLFVVWMFALLVYEWIRLRKASTFAKHLKPALLLLIPFFVGSILLLLNVLAPGNKARAVEGNTSFSAAKLFETLVGCAKETVTDGVQYFLTARPLMVVLLLVIAFSWYECGNRSHESNQTNTVKTPGSPDAANAGLFRHPLLVTIFCFLSASILRAPVIFAGGQDVAAGVSGGVYDSYFFTFVLMAFSWCIYMTGWLKRKLEDKKAGNRFGKVTTVLAVAAFILAIVGARHMVGASLDYTCIRYISSGELADFEAQMEERLAILYSDERDVVLPPMNDQQGPLMHMPVMPDPGAFTNYVTALFYDKDSVIVAESR